ncbi:Crp/Fnr family transcriptional regulator [Nocardioides humilatus]|uniref:Crp/Fnr family transcriptional regulator n=1 Tax=Nocardioides humilatus TaxID=2607660 RepID=A0A5B1LFY3_9ACTN|nr:Crp/Fnr family transcriptional regulator [Nocardioides humilatus]KAA1419336.1 Crp/Fnr family transcriptional regulator [Nocardioides humilatus]
MTATGADLRVGFFGELDPADRAAIASRGRLRRFDTGSPLMREGQAGTEVLVIVSGRAKVTYLTRDGREVILDFRGPGDLLGEMAVVDGNPRSNTVQAIEPVEALAMPAADFRDLVAQSPTLANRLLQNMIRRFRDSDRKVIEFGASHAVGRVAARLVEMVERFGTLTPAGHVIDLPISQDELAGWTGSSREAVAKALHALRELGLVSTDRRSYTVRDLEGLQRRYL